MAKEGATTTKHFTPVSKETEAYLAISELLIAYDSSMHCVSPSHIVDTRLMVGPTQTDGGGRPTGRVVSSQVKSSQEVGPLGFPPPFLTQAV